VALSYAANLHQYTFLKSCRSPVSALGTELKPKPSDYQPESGHSFWLKLAAPCLLIITNLSVRS